MNLTPTPRISKQEYAISLAVAAMRRSEDPYRKVGAVALTEDYRVIATAYNGLMPGADVEDEFWLDRSRRRAYMIHAEQNLCALFKRGEVYTVAVTHYPCPSCAGLLACHGVKRILWLHQYETEPHGNLVAAFHGIVSQRVTHEE